MVNRCAMGLCLCVLSLACVAAGQSPIWTAMNPDAEAARAGVLSDYVVIRADVTTLAAGFRVGDVVGSLPGVGTSRVVADGVEFGGATYHLVRLTSPAMAGALHEAISEHAGLRAAPVIVGQSTSLRSRHDGIPNDPMLENQYAILNDGQTVGGVPGLVGADVGVAQAWGLQRGSAQVRVAVIDSGVSKTHPDLASKLDDGMNVTGGPLGDTDAPFNTHGTHIAGIIGASTNNGQGVVGISWGSRIVPVKAANPIGFTSDVWLAEGLVWAADTDVDVAVLSFGLGAPSDVLADAVRYAYERGVVIVASAGNTGTRGVLYPAAYPEAIAVGATDNTDTLASFSSFGPEVELVAPGVNIFSTRHLAFDPHTYGFESGTSMSTPIVAGIAALMRSADPDISVDEVRATLARTSRDFGQFGRDELYGFGRVNAHRALQQVTGEPWCYADVDGDGVVQPTDFSMWIAIYSSGDPRADQNQSGTVDPADFNAFVINYSAQQGVCGSY